MREIASLLITEATTRLCQDANVVLGNDLYEDGMKHYARSGGSA